MASFRRNMVKILLVLFVLPLLCCGKDQHTKQIQEKPEQAEKSTEEMEGRTGSGVRSEVEN
jgi:hypothetical protein